MSAEDSPVLTHYLLTSPLGHLQLAGRGGWLSGLWFVGERHCPEVSESVPRLMLPTRVDIAEQSAVFDGLPSFVEATCRWLSAYFSRTLSLPPLPDMEWRGTDFQMAVWRELLAVPFGQTLIYGALATRVAVRMGRPSPAVRAVATAVGHNPVSILVPCHRIVGAHGAVGGYAGGVARKLELLVLEGIWLRGE